MVANSTGVSAPLAPSRAGLSPPARLTRVGLSLAVDELTARDPALARVVQAHGLPPLWARRPGYATLVRIILEQQVSLASAAAANRRLVNALGVVTPARVLAAGVKQLRRAGLTQQKAGYCIGIAEAMHEGRLDLRKISYLPDDEARTALMSAPGVGPWTADIYLLMALCRPDIWPRGDLALAKAVMQIRRLRQLPSDERLAGLARQWSPWRAVAARLAWHHYLQNR